MPALESAATGKHIYSRALIATALVGQDITLVIPVTAYVQALAAIPQDLRWQLMLLTTAGTVDLDLLDDREKAHEVADLGAADTTTAHVVWCALRRRWPVVTDRGHELRAIAPTVLIEPLP